jgi:hypothetical protein
MVAVHYHVAALQFESKKAAARSYGRADKAAGEI